MESKIEKTMMFTQRVVQVGCLLIIGLALIACGRITSSPAGSVETTAMPVESNTPSFFTEAAIPYSGTVLHGISEDTPPSLYIRDVLASAFEQETGIKVELEIKDYSQVQEIIESGGETYDYIYIEQDLIYSYLARGLLVDLTQTLQENPPLVSPEFNPVDFTNFIDAFKDPTTGHLYGVPIEAFIKIYVYREDLFEDPDIQAAFAAKYNYPLAPAVTFTQYRDIAAFFTTYGREKDIALWGTTVQAAVGHPASFYEFFETILPSFGVYNWGINPASYKATVANGGQLDGKQAKEALTFWLDMLDYAPPEAATSTWNDVGQSFASGRAAQGWVYGENVAWIALDPTRSQVVGKVGVALPPTSPGVIEDASIGKGYIGYYDGAAFSIPIGSQNKQAALLWLQYLAQPAVQPEWAINSGRIVHLSTFDDPLVQMQDKKLHGYFSLMKEQGHLFAGGPPFPFHTHARDVIRPYIDQAIRGELTPSEALDQAAIAVDEELSRLGYVQ
jgi:multiple sugar transport system substrate-binding protein